MTATDSVRTGEMPGESHWRSLRYFSYYRSIVAGVFLGVVSLSEDTRLLGWENPELFFWLCLVYLLVASGALLAVIRWRHAFDLQLSLQVAADITLLTLLLYAGGGAKSGIAMMILIVLVGAGLVGQGRLVLFYASLAAVFLLLEQSYRVLYRHGEVADFFRTGLTSIGFFCFAIAARLLARRVVANEALARKRGIELADQMRINERVIRDMQDGILVVDAAGRVRQSNPQAARLLDLADAPVALADCGPALVHEHLARRDRGIESETVIQLPESGRTVRARFLPPGEGGNALIYVEDVGRQQQEAQQLKLAALGRLTANMAHEIRNPLASISHAAELLADDPGASAERLVRIIGDNTQRLNRLVSEVMELGRRDRASPEKIELREFLAMIVEEMNIQSPGADKRIDVQRVDELWVLFDRGHLHRVIGNLLGNALAFASEAEAAVRIYGEANDCAQRHMLHVLDDGPGIGQATRSQIFEPFFTTRSTGTGLGLFIARELCAANGAQLELRENSPGAHFCISFTPSWPDLSNRQTGT